MTEQTTTDYPTPRIDAERAAEENFEFEKKAFVARRVNDLAESMTAPEAIKAAKAAVRWGTAKPTTKYAALRIIALEEWRNSPQAEAQREVVRAADIERQIPLNVLHAAASVKRLREALIEAANEEVFWGSDHGIDYATDLRVARTLHGLWASVLDTATAQQISPTEALKGAAQQVQRELLRLSYGTRDPRNRSTSLVRNLTDDLDAWAKETFLHEAARVLGVREGF